jgi:DNA gyrase/topoisomerase IV subunit A
LYLKKGANVNTVIQKLRKFTSFESKFACNFTILDLDGKTPKCMSLEDIYIRWINHRQICIKNELNFDRNRYNKKLHQLKGLETILNGLDKAINIIQNSKTEEEAKNNIIEEFLLDTEQTEYFLTIKLININKGFISNKIKEINNLETLIKDIDNMISSEENINNLIIEQLQEVKKKFSKPRLTDIIYNDKVETISNDMLIEDFTTTLIFTKEQYFKKTRKYSLQQNIKEDDEVKTIIQCSNKDKAIFISNLGNAYFLNLWEQDEQLPSKIGQFLPNLLPLEKNETIIGMLTTNQYKGSSIYVFENSKIAKIPLSSFETKTNRTKLSNALTQENGKVLLITQITDDVDIELTDCFEKTKVVNTKDINSKASKNTVGITSWNCKKAGFNVVSAKIVTNNK